MPDMSCYEGSGTSDTMPWFQCHAAVPATRLTPSSVGSNPDVLETYTTLEPVTSAQAIYAYGVKMVYQATDLTTSPTGSATSSTAGSAASSALSKGAVVALGVAIPLAVLGASVAAFLVWRREKRQRKSRATAAAWEYRHELPTKSQESTLPATLYEMTSEGVMAEMPETMKPVELAN
jgi:hypothetical protein